MGQAATRRFFFACWPDEGLRRDLVERRRQIATPSWRPVPEHNLQLSLLLLGNQPGLALNMICDAADQIKGSAFTLDLNAFGWFDGARVVWLGGNAPDAARSLVGALALAIRSVGLTFQQRSFKPHVTLFRRVAEAPELPNPPSLTWAVHGFSLIESIPNRPYQVLRTWPLKV